MSNIPSQIEMFSVSSPCVDICESGPKGLCLGCFRTRDERLYWHQADDATKRVIVKACFRRKRSALARQIKKDKLSIVNDTDNQKQQDLF